MLELHDPNAHGRDFKIFAIPVILACREPPLFELLREPNTTRGLARRLGANEGHLQGAQPKLGGGGLLRLIPPKRYTAYGLIPPKRY